jgi:DtxR family transcriptional regulator, Mn-dependent transcriptional regulator
MPTLAEENYLKAIYKLTLQNPGEGVSTNALAFELKSKPASVTDMIRRLADKKLLHYEKYQGVLLTETGKDVAVSIVRKHRLWEVFLVEKLRFGWDEVHEMAEQLEHIQSDVLVDRLDHFLHYPQFDPHGDPIPDKDGNMHLHKEITLDSLGIEDTGVIIGVKDHSANFLQYLESIKLVLGTRVLIIKKFDYDQSIRMILDDKNELMVSSQVSENLYVKRINK